MPSERHGVQSGRQFVGYQGLGRARHAPLLRHLDLDGQQTARLRPVRAWRTRSVTRGRNSSAPRMATLHIADGIRERHIDLQVEAVAAERHPQQSQDKEPAARRRQASGIKPPCPTRDGSPKKRVVGDVFGARVRRPSRRGDLLTGHAPRRCRLYPRPRRGHVLL